MSNPRLKAGGWAASGRLIGHEERPSGTYFAGRIFFERSGSGHFVLAAVGGDAGLFRTESATSLALRIAGLIRTESAAEPAASLALRILSRWARNLTINSSSGTLIRLVPSVASTSGPACFGIRELEWSLGQPLQ